MAVNDITQTDPISRTQRKQRALTLQKLGEELTTFRPSQLQQLPLPAKLIDAITQFNHLPNSHGARRRQLQFIGKLMRDCDYDGIISAIAHQKMQRLEDVRQQQPVQQTRISTCCNRILSGGDAEINALLQVHRELERQKLRQFQRDYRRADEGKRSAIKSKLENYLRLMTPQ